MDIRWHYCTLEEYAQGDTVHARALLHDGPIYGTTIQEYSDAGEGLFQLGSVGWELVNVVREMRPGAGPTEPNQVVTLYHLKQAEVTEIWRHCLMISVDASDGESPAIIKYLDWLDEAGNPHTEGLTSKYEGYTKLGADGWKLVQVIEKPAAEDLDGPTSPTTHQYFIRPARSKG